jgi:protein ImuB
MSGCSRESSCSPGSGTRSVLSVREPPGYFGCVSAAGGPAETALRLRLRSSEEPQGSRKRNKPSPEGEIAGRLRRRDSGSAQNLSAENQRRIAAVVLPELLCELADSTQQLPCSKPRGRQCGTRSNGSNRPIPLGVVLLDRVDSSSEAVQGLPGQQLELPIVGSTTAQLRSAGGELAATARLSAVNAEARRLGVREGQTLREAWAISSRLTVRSLHEEDVLEALGRIAETLLAFGTNVSIEAPDTVWVDVTGVARLFGGEQLLATELSTTVRALGHTAHVCITVGPRLAQALARWAAPGERERVVSPAQLHKSIAELPIHALGLAPDRVAWLARVGVLTVSELARLPRAAVAARLGEQAQRVLELCQGIDREPLVRYELPESLLEETCWEEPVTGLEPLLFALRGLVARLSARLGGRGQAAQRLRWVIQCDRSVAAIHGQSPEVVLEFTLAAALWREQELLRVLRARLETLRLAAPSLGMKLEVTSLTEAFARQLDWSRMVGPGAGFGDEATLPVLLSELEAELGRDRVGTFRLLDAHRPEAKGALFPVSGEQLKGTGPRRSTADHGPQPTASRAAGGVRKTSPPAELPTTMTRLLPRAVRVETPLEPGHLLSLGQRMYCIEKIAFERRLEAVEWWTPAPVARDYYRLLLASSEGKLEALVFVDRRTNQRYLYGIAD